MYDENEIRPSFGRFDGSDDFQGRGWRVGRGGGRLFARGEFGPGFGPHGLGHRGPGVPPWAVRRMKRGDIRVAVLGALTDGPAHGYELINRLEARSGGQWRPSPGSVYPMLQALHDEGLLSSVEADSKRVYELTEVGKVAAQEHDKADPWGGDLEQHMKLRGTVGQLLGAARQVGRSGSPELAAKAEEILADAKRKLYLLLADS